jgi:hypothetical protein
LREHAGAIEADLQHYYGIDLTDLWRGTLTPRRAAVLMANLPQGAALWRAMDVPAAWTTAEHLAASQVDALAVANWQRSKAGTEANKAPKPLPRPGVDEAKTVTAMSRAAAFRARQRAKAEED